MPMLSKRIEIKKSKFCTGASIVICIAISSVKKILKPKTISEPPIIKKPALTREIIIQLTMAIFGWAKLNEGFAESDVTEICAVRPVSIPIYIVFSLYLFLFQH